MNKKLLTVYGVLILIVALVGLFFYLEGDNPGLSNNELNNLLAAEEGFSLEYNGEPLTDNSIPDIENNKISANRGNMEVNVYPMIAQDIDGKNVVQYINFSWDGLSPQNIGWVFVYSDQLDNFKIERWTNVTSNINQLVETYTNKTITNYQAYYNLGTPNNECEVGTENNTKMFNIEFNNATHGDYNVTYCFTNSHISQSILEGNFLETQLVAETKEEWVDISNKVSYLGSNIAGNTGEFYRMVNSTFNSGIEYQTRWTYTAKDNSKKGKWEILGYDSNLGIINSLDQDRYLYLDPWWNSSWTKKRLINITSNPGEFSYLGNITYDSDMKSDFSDLRFLNGAEDTELNFTIEELSASSYAIIRVYTNTETEIYMYYGNSGAPSSDSPGDTHFNPVSFYYFDESSGTTAYDSMGTYNLTITGATFNESGFINRSYYFDGSDDITGGTSVSGDFSWGGWIHKDTLAGGDIFQAVISSTTAFNGWLGLRDNGLLRFHLNGGSYFCDTATGVIGAGSWYHVIGTYDGASDVNIYVNGSLVACATESGTPSMPSVSNVVIGDYAAGTNAWQSGRIDEIQIWDRELTSTEIGALYNYSAVTFTYGDEESEFNLSVSTELIYPENNTYINESSIWLNYTSTPSSTNLTNGTSYIWYAGNSSLAYSNTTNLSGNESVNTSNYVMGLDDGVYIWNAESCANATTCSVASNNRTFEIDATVPDLSLSSPNETFDFLIAGDPLFLNWSVNDTNLEYCWYRYPSPEVVYSSDGNWNDNNLSTYDSVGDVHYMNFTGSQNISITTWRSAGSITNSTSNLSSACYSQSPVQVRADTTNIGDEVDIDCYNGTGWDNIVSFSATFPNVVYLSELYYQTPSTLTYVNCSDNTTTFNYTSFNNNITFYANDSAGNKVNNLTLWDYTILEINQTYDSEAKETSSEAFNISINYNSSSWSSVAGYLNYLNESYVGTITGSGDTIFIGRIIDIPSVEAETNNTFNWTLSFVNATGTFNYTSSSNNQTVSRVNFTLCNYSESPQLFFQTFLTTSPMVAINATFQATLTIAESGGTGRQFLVRTIDDNTETNSTWGICIDPNTSNYTVSAVIAAGGTNVTTSNYYLNDEEVSSETQNISLYLLYDNESTLTELKVTDVDNAPVEGVYITIQRYDVGTDTYYNVGMTRTDSDGSDLAYTSWYDVWYKFVGVKDGEVLFTDGPRKISSTPLTFISGEQENLGYENFRDIQYTLVYVNETENFVLTYVDTGGGVSSYCLRTMKRNLTADYLICDTCDTSSSATIYCNINAYGNGTFIADFYATGSPINWIDTVVELKNIQNELYELMGNDDGTGMAILFAGIVLSLFLVTPALGVLGAVLGMSGAMIIGFQPLDYTAFIGIVVVGLLVMWSVKK